MSQNRRSMFIAVALTVLIPPLATAQSISGDAYIVGPGTSGGGGGGDLIYQPTCEAAAYGLHQGDEVWLTQEMWVNGAMLGPPETRTGTGDVTFVLERSLPARGYDQQVSCYFYGGFRSEWYTGTMDGAAGPAVAAGAGPDTVEIKVNAFIQQNWVCKPPACDDIFNGNWRGFDVNGASNSKLAGNAIARNTALFGSAFDGFTVLGGWSEKYEKSTTLEPGPGGEWIKQAARDDWAPGSPMKQEWAQGQGWGSCTDTAQGAWIDGPTDATSRSKVECNFKADNPLMISPYIDVSFTIDFKFGFHVANYAIYGCHDGFPSYEIYLNGQRVHEHTEPVNAWTLFGSCYTSFYRGGSLPRF